MVKWSLGFILLAVLFQQTHAQDARGFVLSTDRSAYHIVQYNSENGLPQNSVNDLLLDKNHYLWIATQYGLVRFDGQRFRIYNTANTPVLKSNRFYIVTETRDHRILVPSSFEGSVIYRVTADYHIQEDTVCTKLRKKLINFYSNGLFDCDRLIAALSKRGATPGEMDLLGQLFRSKWQWIFNGHEAVIGLQQGYYYVNNQTGEIRQLPGVGAVRTGGNQNTRILPGGILIGGITPQRREFVIGDIFCIACHDGSFLFYKGGRPVSIQTDAADRALFQDMEDPDPTKFFITVKGGRSILRRNNDFYDLRFEDRRLVAKLLFKDLTFLKNEPVYTLQYDSAHNRLFAGTLNAGLWVVTPQLFHPYTFTTTDFNNNIFIAFQFLPGGRLLTSNGVLSLGAEGESRLFARDKKLDGHCIYRTRSGDIWYSRAGQLYRCDSMGTHEQAVDGGKLDTPITGMTEDAANICWISTPNSLLKMKNGKLDYVLRGYPAFIDHRVESLTDISAQTLWIATRNGLFQYDKIAGRLDPRPLLAGVYIRNIYKARDGSLWIGTYGNGYYKYLNGEFRTLPLDPDKYLEAAHTFLEDGKGFFWISTNHGLFRIKKAELDNAASGGGGRPSMYYFDKSYGFRTNEFNGGCSPAVVNDGAGHAYFPSMDGIVGFAPDSCQGELPDGPLILDGLAVDSVDLDYRSSQHIRADFTRIVVQVSTPFYGAAENLHIEYSLGGDTWFPVNRDGQIVINRLPYGNYTLEIRKWNGSEGRKYDAIQVAIKVLPHWYNLPLVWVAGLLVLFVIFIYMRTRFWRSQNLKLQMKVDERTFELEKSTMFKENLLSIIIHDLRSPLHAQDLLVETLYRRHQDLDKDQLGYFLGELQTSSRNIVQFTSDFLIWYDSQQDGFAPKMEPLALAPFIDSILSFYEPAARQKNIRLTREVDDSLVLNTDEHLLAIVLRNLVDNGIKYTSTGSVRVVALSSNGRIHLCVRDTGKGMSPQKLDELMTSEPDIRVGGGHFFGYRFVRDFIRRLGGEFHIESEKEVGTTVTIIFGSA
ncbi:sensor histidine kinase [Puia dinghuensis]|uniref:histidine kinase n=1 Tax=Puia dinghuensis TaxID=1792502 RepID=A0A8J2XQW7_9BACT|nr:ATP-binding protein [Puia dinghuensis]GGA84613.1 hypothetical protein GCM10011511_04580 [Puia dinghuensis]